MTYDYIAHTQYITPWTNGKFNSLGVVIAARTEGAGEVVG